MKHILISGCSRGIGFELAEFFLKNGNKVTGFSRSETEAVRKLRASFGEDFSFSETDVRDTDALKKIVSDAADIDVLINNAAIARDGIFSVMSDDDIDACIDVNLRGLMKLTKYVSREMLVRRKGVIINISSVAAENGFRGLSAYAATKSALDGFIRAAARELGERNIRINNIMPGFIRTEMSKDLCMRDIEKITARTPLRRLATARDIAELCDFLISDKASFITGQTVVVDGGMSC